MLQEKSESFNNLRVASSLWSGLVYYQGVTAGTTLTTANKAVQTEVARACPGAETVQAFRPDSLADRPRCGTRKTSSSTKHPGVGESCPVGRLCKRQERNSGPPAARTYTGSSQQSQPAGSDYSAGTSYKRKTQCGKAWTLLSLPSVAWNELPPPAPRDASTSGLAPSANFRRPSTAGPRIFVPPKHSCPPGLGTDDIVRGRQLFGDNSVEEISSKDESNSSSNDERKHVIKRLTRKIHSRDETMKPLTPVPKSAQKDVDVKTAALKLTITSLHPGVSTNLQTTESNATESKPVDQEKFATRSSNTFQQCFHDAHNLDTIEGIRKSYRRAQSAPPSNERAGRLMDSCVPSRQTQGDVKHFSNLYWRAKSAYHRRLDAAGEEDPNEDGKGDKPAKHTLLRPLLCVKGDLKHGPGCPHKCQGCFKACLVSDDYVQKAIARCEQQLHAPTPVPRLEAAKVSSGPSARLDMVRGALGRSQPLFQQVYGGKMKTKIKIRPWPTYGWMNLTSKNEAEEKEST